MDADNMTYSLEDWADYVRGLGNAQIRRTMKAHLASAGDGSREDVHLLEDVRRLLREDACLPADASPEDTAPEDTAPEDDVVWTVKALPTVVPERFDELPRLPLTLVSEGTADDAAIAQRHGHPYLGARKLLYRSERFELDLWLEGPHGSSRAVVLGKISLTDPVSEPKPVEAASIFLIEESHVAASTLTNAFGEFYLEASPEGDISLKIIIRHHGQIVLSLPQEDL